MLYVRLRKPSSTMPHSNRIFEWLGSAGTVPYYLIPLNLVWSDRGVDFDLDHFESVARRLENEPEYWRNLLRGAGWREQLAATTCALVTGSRHLREDFQEAIMLDSFIVPQLLVALSLLHGDEVRGWLIATSAKEWPSERFKTYGALEPVCQLLKIPFIPPLEYHNNLESDEYSIGKNSAAEHLEFWAPRIPA